MNGEMDVKTEEIGGFSTCMKKNSFSHIHNDNTSALMKTLYIKPI